MANCYPVAALLLLVLGISTGSGSEPNTPQPIAPESLQWASPPGNPLVQGAWVIGSEQEAGIYAFRVKMAKGGRIPLHTHPDTRFTTVLSGTLYVGFAAPDEDTDFVAVPAGAVYVAPAGQPHYVWARDGDVEYQESGTGPTAVVPVH